MSRNYIYVTEDEFLIVLDELSDYEVDIPNLIEDSMIASSQNLTPKSYKQMADLHTQVSRLQVRLQHWIDINKEQLKWPILV